MKVGKAAGIVAAVTGTAAMIAVLSTLGGAFSGVELPWYEPVQQVAGALILVAIIAGLVFVVDLFSGDSTAAEREAIRQIRLEPPRTIRAEEIKQYEEKDE